MATRPLIGEERERCRAHVDEKVRRLVGSTRTGNPGLAEHCYQAADGDGHYALWLAVNASHHLIEEGRELRATLVRKKERRRSLRASYEEIVNA